MKNKLSILLVITVVLAMTIVGVIYAENSSKSGVTSQTSTVTDPNFVDLPLLSDKDMKDKQDAETTDYNGPTTISKEQAIAIATDGGKVQCKAIHAQKKLLTNKSYQMFSSEELKKNSKLKEKGYLDKDPVWIVSFEGLTIQSSQPFIPNEEPQEMPPSRAHTEQNTVIDAMTGEVLYIFSFR